MSSSKHSNPDQRCRAHRHNAKNRHRRWSLNLQVHFPMLSKRTPVCFRIRGSGTHIAQISRQDPACAPIGILPGPEKVLPCLAKLDPG